ncbi:MAG: tetratricopeptide repeat protein [bacterium]
MAIFIIGTIPVTKEPWRYYIELGFQATMNEEFDLGKKIFERIIEEDPQDPAGYFFLGVMLEAEMMAKEDWALLDSLKKLFKTSAELSKKDDNDPYALFIRGNSLGYLAILSIKDGDYIEALPYIRGTVGNLSKATKIKPDLYDAYIALGGYYYWKGKKLGFLNNILFLEDDREKGLKYLRLASEKATFSRDIAKHSLIFALIEEKEFDEAKRLCEYLMKKYPNSTLPLWDALAIAEAEENYPELVNITEKLLEKLRAEKNSNYYNIVEVLYKRAKAADKLNWYTETLNAANEALKFELPEETMRRQSQKVRELKELKNRLTRRGER